MGIMRYYIIYCRSCKKVLGRYNTKFFSNDKIGEFLRTIHATHIKQGHDIEIQNVSLSPPSPPPPSSPSSLSSSRRPDRDKDGEKR